MKETADESSPSSCTTLILDRNAISKIEYLEDFHALQQVKTVGTTSFPGVIALAAPSLIVPLELVHKNLDWFYSPKSILLSWRGWVA